MHSYMLPPLERKLWSKWRVVRKKLLQLLLIHTAGEPSVHYQPTCKPCTLYLSYHHRQHRNDHFHYHQGHPFGAVCLRYFGLKLHKFIPCAMRMISGKFWLRGQCCYGLQQIFQHSYQVYVAVPTAWLVYPLLNTALHSTAWCIYPLKCNALQ